MILLLARIGFGFGLFASLAGLLALWVPILDALNHVRLITLLAALSLLAVTWRGAVAYRRPIALLVPLNLALIAVPAYLTAAELAPRGIAHPPEKVLKLISFNVWTENKTPQAVVDFLLREQADIVLLVELRRVPANSIIPHLEASYPHREVCLGCGMALFSRFPFETSHAQRRDKGVPFVGAHIGEVDIGLTGTHLLTPDRAAIQVNELKLLTANFMAGGAARERGRIIAGDFNMTPWSMLMADFLRTSGYRRHGTLHHSWPSIGWLPPFVLIDHVVTSPDIKTISIEAGPDIGSDHRPIIARLLLP
ncbi:MAG: endonuclease/exonuclease/phosphatase family protein [Hyphomicrobiaceae bacterium]